MSLAEPNLYQACNVSCYSYETDPENIRYAFKGNIRSLASITTKQLVSKTLQL